jgi:hypothetical protein
VLDLYDRHRLPAFSVDNFVDMYPDDPSNPHKSRVLTVCPEIKQKNKSLQINNLDALFV